MAAGLIRYSTFELILLLPSLTPSSDAPLAKKVQAADQLASYLDHADQAFIKGVFLVPETPDFLSSLLKAAAYDNSQQASPHASLARSAVLKILNHKNVLGFTNYLSPKSMHDIYQALIPLLNPTRRDVSVVESILILLIHEVGHSSSLLSDYLIAHPDFIAYLATLLNEQYFSLTHSKIVELIGILALIKRSPENKKILEKKILASNHIIPASVHLLENQIPAHQSTALKALGYLSSLNLNGALALAIPPLVRRLAMSLNAQQLPNPWLVPEALTDLAANPGYCGQIIKEIKNQHIQLSSTLSATLLCALIVRANQQVKIQFLDTIESLCDLSPPSRVYALLALAFLADDNPRIQEAFLKARALPHLVVALEPPSPDPSRPLSDIFKRAYLALVKLTYDNPKMQQALQTTLNETLPTGMSNSPEHDTAAMKADRKARCEPFVKEIIALVNIPGFDLSRFNRDCLHEHFPEDYKRLIASNRERRGPLLLCRAHLPDPDSSTPAPIATPLRDVAQTPPPKSRARALSGGAAGATAGLGSWSLHPES